MRKGRGQGPRVRGRKGRGQDQRVRGRRGRGYRETPADTVTVPAGAGEDFIFPDASPARQDGPRRVRPAPAGSP